MTKTFLIAATASVFALIAAPEMQQSQTAPEVSTQEDVAVFQSKVTLIEVPVVVRDKKGKAVGTLRQEDFQLFDKGKPQVISKFSVEKSGGGKVISQTSGPDAEGAPDGAPVIAPNHFVGFLFDDLHMEFADLVYTRTATQKFIAANLNPADRVAIFTTSGQNQLAFTDDRDSMNKVLLKIAPHPYSPPPGCPSLSFVTAHIGSATSSIRGCRTADSRRNYRGLREQSGGRDGQR